MIKVFNTLGKKKQILKTIKDKTITMYSCGPTVYDFIHIGNARTFLAFDVIARYLKYRGYKVKHVQNITDVGHLTESELAEDKILKAAEKEKVTPLQIAKKYTEKYYEAMEKLNWNKPDISPKASEHVKDMIKLVEVLLKKDFAYEVDGTVYFDISKFKNYGKLSGNTLEKLEAGGSARIKKEEIAEKKHPHDFALWFKAPKDHAMKWKSPWGMGYPGWHIECSVMSSKYLGQPFDIHGGGKDLIFPHHENEIAQAEAARGKKFVNYWLHSEYLKINGQKMSKSLGNFFTAEEFISKHGAQLTRYFLISKHYQTELNITDAAIAAAKEGFDKLKNTVVAVQHKIVNSPKGVDSRVVKEFEKHRVKFIKEIDNNFNTPGGFAAIFDLAKDLNVYEGKAGTLQAGLDLLLEMTGVLGLVLVEDVKVPKKIKDLVAKREWARSEKKWSEADKLREEIKKLGYGVDDTKEGTIVKKI
ncbi:MAG: cysteine--tRNA ligase [Nanoarchaeota archaeon]|nr:cysteine--tRNA ligase [Nanoarchaeota archaeon]